MKSTTSTAITTTTSTTSSALLLASDVEVTERFLRAPRARSTARAYASDMAAFETWCSSRGLCPLPALPSTVAVYVAYLAEQGRKASTIDRALVSISQSHKRAGHASPRHDERVRLVLANVRRTIGTAQTGKAALPVSSLRAAAAVRDDLKGLRDRALLAVGFSGGFRRSELVGLDLADVEVTPEGLVVTIRRSKTDQSGEGRKVGLPYGGNPSTCPVRTLRAWLDAAQIQDGPLFRGVDRHENVSHERLTDRAVADIVKSAAQVAGLDPAAYAGHSLRRGFATAAAKAGKGERQIMRMTGHKSERMVRKYITESTLFVDNAAAGIGL